MLTASIGIACGDRDTGSPTAPSIAQPSPSHPQPAPGATSVTIHGRVTEPAPTPATGIAGAVISVDDGSGASKSALADALGVYAVEGVAPGLITIDVSADGYVATSRRVVATTDTTSDFQLALVPKTMTNVITGDLDPSVGACSDGISDKPCNIVVIPVHNSGAIETTLTWNPVASGSLTITLFQTGQATPIARSTGQANGTQQVSATVSGSADYEFRITYGPGTGRVNYSVSIMHPN